MSHSSNVVPGPLILFTLMMEATHASETLVLTIATRHHIPEDGILNSHCRENLKSYSEVNCSKHSQNVFFIYGCFNAIFICNCGSEIF
jgi:hypothetical protein